MIDWARVRAGCPRCGAPTISYHSLTWWCHRCGIARNWSSKVLADGWSFPPLEADDDPGEVDPHVDAAMLAQRRVPNGTEDKS